MQKPEDILKGIYLGVKERNSHYSLSAFARDLEISPSLLTRIFNGQRALSYKLAEKVIFAFNLNEEQGKNLISATLEKATKNSKISKIKRKEAKTKFAFTKDVSQLIEDMELFRSVSHWKHLAILNLIETDDFNPEPAWIGQRLGLSIIEIEDALSRLELLGLIKRKDQTWERIQKSLFFNTDHSHEAIRSYHRAMIQKASNELERKSQKDFERRLINSITVCCSHDQIDILKNKIDQFQDEILELCATQSNQEVYQMNIQLFPLTKEIPKEKQ
jgi:uncharacterized protein (TIGR02147 family)